MSGPCPGLDIGCKPHRSRISFNASRSSSFPQQKINHTKNTQKNEFITIPLKNRNPKNKSLPRTAPVPFANSYELLAELEEEEFKVEHLVFPISLSTSNGVIVTPASFDCGCSSNIIDDKFAFEHELPRIPRDVPVDVETVDGSPMGTATIVEKDRTKMKIGDHEEITSFNVSTSGYYKVILGISWMTRHNPSIDYVNGTMTFDSEFCKKNCLHGNNITTTAIPAKEAGRQTSTKKIHCTTRTRPQKT